MKYKLLSLLVLTCLHSHARSPHREAPTEQDAVIFGVFVQRLGFSSGGFVQSVEIRNIEDGHSYKFVVKPTFKSAKKNDFNTDVPPGIYEVVSYIWTQSKWYGATSHFEPIYKYVTHKQAIAGQNNGTINGDTLQRYRFSVEAGKLNYVGTWHFEKERVFFKKEDVNTEYLEDVGTRQIVANIPK